MSVKNTPNLAGDTGSQEQEQMEVWNQYAEPFEGRNDHDCTVSMAAGFLENLSLEAWMWNKD